MGASYSRKGSGLKSLEAALDRIRKSEVLVGIPAEKASRRGDAINNPSLLFIHTKGSELNNLPARPVLEPSIEKNKAIIAPHLGEAARNLIAKKPQEALRELNLAGDIAASGAKQYFVEPNPWPPDKPETIARKARKHSGGRKGKAEPFINQTLIDFGRMRNAISWLVRTDDGR